MSAPQAHGEAVANNRTAHPNAFRLLWQYIARERRMVIAASLWLTLATLCDVAGPMLAKRFIDHHLIPQQFATVDLLWLLAAYVTAQLLAPALRFLQTLRFSRLALAAVQDIRERAFRHVLALPMAWHDRAITGQLVSRITNDTEAIKDLYVQFLATVVGNVVFLIGTLAAMALLSLKLMAIAALLIPLVIVIIRQYERYSGRAVSEARQLRSDINAQLSEAIQGMRVIQAVGQGERFASRFDSTNSAQYRVRLQSTRIGALLLRPALDLVGIAVLAGVLFVFGSDALRGGVEVGVLYAFVNYLSRYTEPLMEITQRFNLYQQAMVAGSRLSALLDEKLLDEKLHDGSLPSQDPHYPQPALHGPAAITVSALDFGYQPDHPVLQKINLHIAPGDFVGIVGHTGSGKSTLMSLLLRFYQPQQGEIRLDGRALATLPASRLHGEIGLIPQEPFILAGSLRDNILLGRDIDTAALQQAVQSAQLAELVARLPQGLDTLLGERGTRLSTGERQLLALARALVTRPRLLLLDEATANIDSETEQQVQQALQQLRGQVTIVAIAHRLSTVRDADNIIVLRHGRVIEQGDHAQLMALPEGYYRRMMQLQTEREELEQLA